ncbi:MAG: glycoside hydrolase family 3 N-terminal domain-containing protein, partial [Mangrovicoccus sp.]
SGPLARLWLPRRLWPAPLDMAQALEPGQVERAFYLRYRLIAAELSALGIDANCAPMADIAMADTHHFLRNRCYGTDLPSVIANARATSEGLLDGGVLPVLKHIPGHGRGTLDSHLDLPKVTAEADALKTLDFAAFAGLNDLPMAMTAHIVYAAIDDQAPATQSAPMIQVIRDQIGFDGLLMTDDLSMQALSGSMRARCESSLGAGCDVILHCNGDMAEMQEIAAASGDLAGQAALRADAALASKRVVSGDIEALTAEWDELSQSMEIALGA